MNRWPALAEFRSLGVLAVPIIITQLAQMGMGVADAIMAGRVSATELAGIALGGNLYWPLMLLMSDKGVRRRFLAESTGLSLPHVERLIRQHRDTGKVRRRIANCGKEFSRRYLAGDIRLLAEVDEFAGAAEYDTTSRTQKRKRFLDGASQIVNARKVVLATKFGNPVATVRQPVPIAERGADVSYQSRGHVGVGLPGVQQVLRE